jgi:hypothetical protein
MNGHTIEVTALDTGFNFMVALMAERYAPGWKAAPVAPETLEALKESHKRDGFITVWDGESDRTIFGEAHFNHAFRAWHDAVHLMYDLPFTLDGERAAAEMQCEHVKRHYGTDSRALKWCEMIRCEVAGQAEHFAKTGDFPADQVEFAKGYLAARGVAI